MRSGGVPKESSVSPSWLDSLPPHDDTTSDALAIVKPLFPHLHSGDAVAYADDTRKPPLVQSPSAVGTHVYSETTGHARSPVKMAVVQLTRAPTFPKGQRHLYRYMGSAVVLLS